MRTEEETRARREWFYNRALEFEKLAADGDENMLYAMESFTVVVGTLDWVLAEGEE